MDISSVKLAYFSPTKTTQKVLEAIARGVGTRDVEHINLTRPVYETITLPDCHDELIIFGAPVYGGRLPAAAVIRISRLKGNNTPAVVVVVYGNREYEDALLELKDLVAKSGFIPIAGGAFIGEHSFTSPEAPIANGRPDDQDLQKSKEFGMAIQKKMEAIGSIENVTPITVPGNYPYKDGMPPRDDCAETLDEICIVCGTCVDVCPTAAVTLDERVRTDPKACIMCCACVKNCPSNARVMTSPHIKMVSKWLSENCSTPKKPEIFI